MTMLPMRQALGIGFSWRACDPLMLWRRFMGQPSRVGGLLGLEARHIGTVAESFSTFGRQLLGVIQGAVNVALPNFTRQLVEQLDAITVGIMNIKAVGHTMVDPAIELDATLLQERQLLEPRFPVWQGHGDVADRARHPGHAPFGRRRREAGVLDQCQVVVAQGAVAVIATVEAHLWRIRARRSGLQLADLLE